MCLRRREAVLNCTVDMCLRRRETVDHRYVTKLRIASITAKLFGWGSQYLTRMHAQTGFLRTLTKIIYISAIFSTLNPILSVANLSRLECAENPCRRVTPNPIYLSPLAGGVRNSDIRYEAPNSFTCSTYMVLFGYVRGALIRAT
jgi:hypothetical protein